MSKHTWREIWAKAALCRTQGHIWGERRYYGDSIREHGGTHRCARCERCGYPEETP